MIITPDQIPGILERHIKWLRDEPGGQRANLTRADLSWANLSVANLSRADLSGANLTRADLSWANLSVAKGIYRFACVSFSGHGECGRMLSAIIREKGQVPKLSCGCFSGDTGALREYIEKGPEHLRKTRTWALDTVLAALDMQNDEQADAGQDKEAK